MLNTREGKYGSPSPFRIVWRQVMIDDQTGHHFSTDHMSMIAKEFDSLYLPLFHSLPPYPSLFLTASVCFYPSLWLCLSVFVFLTGPLSTITENYYEEVYTTIYHICTM